VHVHNPRKTKRKHGGILVSGPETNEYKVFFKKRRLMDNFDSHHMDISNLFMFIYL